MRYLKADSILSLASQLVRREDCIEYMRGLGAKSPSEYGKACGDFLTLRTGLRVRVYFGHDSLWHGEVRK